MSHNQIQQRWAQDYSRSTQHLCKKADDTLKIMAGTSSSKFRYMFIIPAAKPAHTLLAMAA